MRHTELSQFDYTVLGDHVVDLNSQMAYYEWTKFYSMPNSIASIRDTVLNLEHVSTC